MLSNSLEELGFFPKATQALLDDTAGFFFKTRKYFVKLGRSS